MYVESHGGASDFAYTSFTDYGTEFYPLMKTWKWDEVPFESSLMTRFLDHLTRMMVFLALGLALPVVFLSSLVKFRVVTVGVIVYVAYVCQFVVSLYFE